MTIVEDRILLHLQDGKRIPVDPQEIYLLEAEGGETLVRTRHAQPLNVFATFACGKPTRHLSLTLGRTIPQNTHGRNAVGLP